MGRGIIPSSYTLCKLFLIIFRVGLFGTGLFLLVLAAQSQTDGNKNKERDKHVVVFPFAKIQSFL